VTTDDELTLDAARHLLNGGLVAFPTETVYGIGADAANHAAVDKIFRAKQRPPTHPLIVHLSSSNHLQDWVDDIPQCAWDLVEAFWPGPLTLILPKKASLPENLSGGQNTIGLRMPDHPVAIELLQAFASLKSASTSTPQPTGIAAPSANRFGHVSPTTAAHVRSDLCSPSVSADLLPMVLDGGACRVGLESTILDLSSPRPAILRPGMLDAIELAKILGAAPDNLWLDRAAKATTPRVSGSLVAHYVPRTPACLLLRPQLIKEIKKHQATGGSLAVLSCGSPMPIHLLDLLTSWINLPKEPYEYGQQLYASLHTIDANNVSMLLIERPPENAAWSAIIDRLQRATACTNAA